VLLPFLQFPCLPMLELLSNPLADSVLTPLQVHCHKMELFAIRETCFLVVVFARFERSCYAHNYYVGLDFD